MKKNPWAELDALIAAEQEPKGDEWFTAKEFGDRYGFGNTTATRRTSALVKEGKLERWIGRGKTGGYLVKYRFKGA